MPTALGLGQVLVMNQPRSGGVAVWIGKGDCHEVVDEFGEQLILVAKVAVVIGEDGSAVVDLIARTRIPCVVLDPRRAHR